MLLQKKITTVVIALLVALLKYVIPNLSTGKLYLFLDIVVVSIKAIIFRNIDNALYMW